MGIIKESTDIDKAVELNLDRTFMPHGLSHYIGLYTHDVGLPKPDAEVPTWSTLFQQEALQTNMLLTVEPGIYFIKLLIEKLRNDEALNGYINWERVDELTPVGGVRIEDIIAITPEGNEQITNCPRTVEEIEAYMSKA
jgi:Xaa-Pro aminopeptidase